MTRYPHPYPFQHDEDPREPKVGLALAALLILLIVIVISLTPYGPAARSRLLTTGGETLTAGNRELASWQSFYAVYEAAGVLPAGSPIDRLLYTVDPDYGRFDRHFLARNPEIGVCRRYLENKRR